MDALIALDFWLFTLVNDAHLADLLARPMRVITLLGDVRVFAPLVLVSAAVLFGRRWWRAAAALSLALALTGALTFIGKASFDRPRPTAVGGLCEDARDRPEPLAAGFFAPTEVAPHPVTLRTARTCAMSFPSGHTSAAFTWLLGLALLLGARRSVVAAAVGLAALTGLSRIVLGVHYPLDTLVGAAIGIASALTCARLLAPRLLSAPARAEPTLALAGADLDPTPPPSTRP